MLAWRARVSGAQDRAIPDRRVRRESRSDCVPDADEGSGGQSLAFYEDHRGEVDLLVARQMATTPETP